MDFTNKTLGEFLSSPDQTIKRNAVSILKRLQNCPHERRPLANGHEHTRVCDVCDMWFQDRMK